MAETPREPAARDAEYAEYYEQRRPIALGERLVAWWHRRMLRVVSRLAGGAGGLSPLLEVGAGWGHFAEACKEAGVSYAGVEMNAAQAARLRERGFDVVAATMPPAPPGPPVAAVWMSHVLEHARDPGEALAMVRAAASRLAPGGRLVVIGPDVAFWREHFFAIDWSHGYPTERRRVAQLLAEAGLDVEAAHGHVAGTASRWLVPVAGGLFALVPVRLADALLEAVTGRPLASSLMSVVGWRQLLVVGRKRG